MRERVLYLGGNGHAAVRLDAARAALAARGEPFALVDVPYPGFEGRRRAPDLESFLDALEGHAVEQEPDLVHAAGIGALLALCLRARGALSGVPLVLQGPVLWGLEHRMMPRVLRVGVARAAVRSLFAMRGFQRHFAARHFRAAQPGPVLRAFFDGYARCDAFEDLFEWCTPDLLRELEAAFADTPQALDGVTAWCGDHDTVVTVEEVLVTGEALGATFPVRRFADWGHYPMMDDPQGWVEALADALA